VEEWRRILMCLSGGAAFTGVLCVVLTTKGKITAFFWGAINSLLYGLFAYAYGYAGDAQLNLFFFLPVQFWGIYSWGNNLLQAGETTNHTVESQSLTPFQWLLCLILCGGITVGFFYEIPVFAVAISGTYYFEGKNIPRSLDSLGNAFSMIGQMLSIWRYSEQWYFWIIVDCLQIAMYTSVAGYGIVINVVVMWCLFLCNALFGLYAWNIRYYYSQKDYLQARTVYAHLQSNQNDDNASSMTGTDIEKSQYHTDPNHINAIPVTTTMYAQGNLLLMEEVELTTEQPAQQVISMSSAAEERAYDHPQCITCTLPFVFGNAKKGFRVLRQSDEDDMENNKNEETYEQKEGVDSNNNNQQKKKKKQLKKKTHKILYIKPDNKPNIPSSVTINMSSDKPKEYKRGLIIGKFWPFHRGHQFLLDEAMKFSDEVYIILCHRLYHIPTAADSEQAIQEYYDTLSFPKPVYTMIIRDCYDPEDSQLWANLTKSWCGFVPDIVFTSESYGDEYVKALGPPCRHQVIDQPRSVYPVSGTVVRENPYRYWLYISGAIRSHYCRRIVIVGPESTGKSTLASQLATYYQCPLVTEYGREFCEEQLAERELQNNSIDNNNNNNNNNNNDHPKMIAAQMHSLSKATSDTTSTETEEFIFTEQDFETIMIQQAKREEEAARKSINGMIICDTNIWATLLWYERYMKKPPSKSIQKLYKQLYKPPFHYIFCDLKDTIFVQDGVRDGRLIRGMMNRMFLKALSDQRLSYTRVLGKFETRFTQAKNIIDEKIPLESRQVLDLPENQSKGSMFCSNHEFSLYCG
jgi:HTH-type transcriptional regulator, transcriptional repressor of NAD biosynthesis genes